MPKVDNKHRYSEPKITFGVSVGGSATSIMPKCESVKVIVGK